MDNEDLVIAIKSWVREKKDSKYSHNNYYLIILIYKQLLPFINLYNLLPKIYGKINSVLKKKILIHQNNWKILFWMVV